MIVKFDYEVSEKNSLEILAPKISLSIKDKKKQVILGKFTISKFLDVIIKKK